MLFSDVVGLDELKETLIHSVKNNHIAHAQLFLGPNGSANLALALAYCNYIMCENKQDNDACGVCPGCSKNRKFIHPDLHFVFPVSTTKKVTKDPVSEMFLPDWRSFLSNNIYGDLGDWLKFFGAENKQGNISKEESRNIIRTLALKPFEAEYKVLLIWTPENLHPTAANALLKILEEPPGKTIFLLVAYDIERIIATILSRTQLVKVRHFTDKELANNLVEKFNFDQKRAEHLAYLAEGNLNEALKLDEEAEDNNESFFRDWMRVCYTKDYTKMVNVSEGFQGLSKEAQKILLQYGLSMLRECMLWQLDVKNLIKLEGDEKDFVQNFSKVLNPSQIEKISNLLNTSFYHLERNANPKILFLDLSLSVSTILRG
jgi:DNA polymerase III subunit delta'